MNIGSRIIACSFPPRPRRRASAPPRQPTGVAARVPNCVKPVLGLLASLATRHKFTFEGCRFRERPPGIPAKHPDLRTNPFAQRKFARAGTSHRHCRGEWLSVAAMSRWPSLGICNR